MNEQEWLEHDDMTPMLALLRGTVSDRKLRLFAVACCRRVWHLLVDARSREAVEIAEQYADGVASELDLRAACGSATLAIHRFSNWDADAGLEESYRTAAHCAAWVGIQGEEGNTSGASRKAEIENAQLRAVRFPEKSSWAEGIVTDGTWRAKYLRDIFGNPFRPITIDAGWLSSTVIDLARTIYEEEILNHCRSEGPHVRGCWVVDLLMGKK